VERRGSDNWTWQPQRRWDPASRQFRGFVDMHMPDAWGYLQFALPSAVGDGNSLKRDTTNDMNVDMNWPAKLTAMTVYYALHYHKETTGAFTSSLEDLVLPAEIVDPFDIQIALTNDGAGFVVSTTRGDSLAVVRMRNDRLLTVEYHSKEFLVS
jgi:hypothetical protein